MTLNRPDNLVRMAVLVAVTLNGQVVSAARRPAVLTDRGACPFECCVYRDWYARRRVKLYSAPKSDSRQIATIAPGTRVQAVTGFVRTSAGRFTVKRDHGVYRAGDTIWVYTYHGEGYFTVWYRGRLYKESLEFSPYGGGVGKRVKSGNHRRESAECASRSRSRGEALRNLWRHDKAIETPRTIWVCTTPRVEGSVATFGPLDGGWRKLRRRATKTL